MFENPIGAAIVAIRIGRNEDYEVHGSLLVPKRTSLVAPHMTAFGGKADMGCYDACLARGGHEATRIYQFAWRRGRMAGGDARAAVRADATHWRSDVSG